MTTESASRRRIVSAMLAALVVIVAGAFVINRTSPPFDQRLTQRNLQNATFHEPPPAPPAAQVVSTVWKDFWAPPNADLRREVLPTQSGVLWIAVIVALMVGFDFSRPASSRNLELIVLVILGPLMFNIMRFFDHLEDPIYFTMMDWVFTGIVSISLALIGLAVWRVRHAHTDAWRPNLPVRALVTLTAALLAVDVGVALFEPPDDAGFYTNLGAQRLRERGLFPYGDPLLTNSAGAGYGPVLYLAHVPYQVLLHPSPVNTNAPTRADLAAGAAYVLPPQMATQLTTVTFHIVGVIALVLIGLRLSGPAAAWGLAALYCGSAYVMGVGGPSESIGGMTFVSHIAPPAMSLLAFAALSRPMAAGALLVAAAGTVFYPVLFIPAWLGHYWNHRASALKFAAGLALAGVLIGVPVLLRSRPVEGRSVLGTVIHESVGHHQGTDTYGLSTFGFWGQRHGVREWFREPLAAGEFMTSPMFALTIGAAAALFFLARGSTPQQLALLTGIVGILAQWSKIHGTGVYVTWYYPFLLIGFFASARTQTRGDLRQV